MEFNELDRLFDQAIKRADKQNPIALDPYSQGPHSADHFLLKKSWAYFKERMRTIESHWEEIAAAKDQEMSTLKEELNMVRAELEEATLKNSMLDKFEEEVRKTRSNDYINFDRLNERLKQAWEEERQSLATQLSAVEFALQKEKERNVTLQNEMARRARALNSTVDALKEENQELTQKNLEAKQADESKLIAKDEDIAGRDLKIDLLRSEIERRDIVLAQQAKELEAYGTKVDALLLRIKHTDETVADRDLRIKNLLAEVERLEFEKNALRTAWQNEQAQWRELWDRSRELWDKKKKEENI